MSKSITLSNAEASRLTVSCQAHADRLRKMKHAANGVDLTPLADKYAETAERIWQTFFGPNA